MPGLAALVVTNGVGSLSVMNGIAGAYSEHVPVICICGSLPLGSLERGEIMHHTLADGGRGNFYRAFSERRRKELERVLTAPHKGLVFVEALMDKDDSPETLIRAGHAFAHSDFGPTGPQFVPGANIALPKS
jgi:TPP-dependent 2-oxoacid decarboxylase